MNACCSIASSNGLFPRRFSTSSVPKHCPQCCTWAPSSPHHRWSLDCGHGFPRHLSLSSINIPLCPPCLDRGRLPLAKQADSGRERSDTSTEIDTSELSVVSSETACQAAELISGSYQQLPDGVAPDRPSVWKYCVSPRPAWRGLLLGQILSLLLAVCGGVDHQCTYPRIHTALGFFGGCLCVGFRIAAHYALLCPVFVVWAVVNPCKCGVVATLRHRCWCYLLLAIADIEAIYLYVTAAYYTSTLGVQLLGSVAVPVAMLISCAALDVNYKTVHVFATFLCFTGLACNAWPNFKDLAGPDNILGITLGLAGAVLRSVATVLQEYAVKTWHWGELLAMLSLFGTVCAALQAWLFLGVAVAEEHLLVQVVQVASLVLFQCLALVMLKDSGATAMLLSLFTASFYLPFTSLWMCQFLRFTGIAPVQMLYENKVDIMHYISMVLVLSGLLVYFVKRTPILSEQTENHSVPVESSTGSSAVKESYQETTPLRQNLNKQ